MKTLLSWSTGKDSAWSLYELRQTPGIEVAGLFTTFNAAFDRVATHAVRRALLEAQAAGSHQLIDVLRDLRVVRENYHMIDDEYQFAIVVARWITDPKNVLDLDSPLNKWNLIDGNGSAAYSNIDAPSPVVRAQRFMRCARWPWHYPKMIAWRVN